MRIKVSCEDRLGICHDILAVLKQNSIDLHQVEIEPTGKIYLRFPGADFDMLRMLLPKIRMVEGVLDVKTIQMLPSERGQQELAWLLNSLPNPIITLDRTGKVQFANRHFLSKARLPQVHVLERSITDVLTDFPQLALQQHETEYKELSLTLGKKKYRALLVPLWTEETQTVSFAGFILKFAFNPQPFQPDTDALPAAFQTFLTQHEGMLRILKDASRMAVLHAPLLLEGETGVGKELIARACHQAGPRVNQPFLAVNCGALPDNVAESELFGYGPDVFAHHPKGKKGIIEQADGGTVLLDSIADMSKELQAKLLRFLEDGEFRRIGEEQMVSVNIRLICLSRGDLLEKVEKGLFREDLYYRLNVLSLYIPPLRERQGDIALLTEYFIHQFCQQLRVPLAHITKNCLHYLTQYPWPGNVRQLENSLYRAVSMLDSELMDVDNLLLPEPQSPAMQPSYYQENDTLEQAIKRFEKSILKHMYPKYPSTRLLARQLGLSHTSIANKLKEYGIQKNTS